MSVRVSFSGFPVGAITERMRKYGDVLRGEIKKQMSLGGASIAREARTNHNYQRRSGNLDRAIKYALIGDGLALAVYIDDAMLTTAGGWSYGAMQHDGTYDGYRPSPISMVVSPTVPKTPGGGIEADPFLYRAWESGLDDMRARVVAVQPRVLRWVTTGERK